LGLAWPGAFSLGINDSLPADGGGMIPAALAASDGGAMIMPAACLVEVWWAGDLLRSR